VVKALDKTKVEVVVHHQNKVNLKENNLTGVFYAHNRHNYPRTIQIQL
jgi:hypothetical protein